MREFIKLTNYGVFEDDAQWILVRSPYLTTYCNYDLAKKIKDYPDYIEMFSTWFNKWIQLPKTNLTLHAVSVVESKQPLEFLHYSKLLKMPVENVLKIFSNKPVLFSHLSNTMSLGIGKFEFIMHDGSIIVDVNKKYVPIHRIAPIDL